MSNKVQGTEKVDERPTSRVINVPTELKDKELHSLRSNIIEELQRKSCSGSLVTDKEEDEKHQSKKIPTVRFSKRPTKNVNPKDLQASLLNELSRFSLSRGDEAPLSPTSILKQVSEKGYQISDNSTPNQRLPKQTTGGSLTSDNVPLSETSFSSAPVGNVGTPANQMFYYAPPQSMCPSMDPQRLDELMRWHCQQRESLSEELRWLQSSVNKNDGEAPTLFGKKNLERVLRSLRDALDCIFTETITALGRVEKAKHENTDTTASTSMEKQTTINKNADNIFEDITSSSSSSYSSLISEIEKVAVVKEEEFRNEGSETKLDVIYEDEDFNNFIMRSLLNENNFLEESNSSEDSLIVEEGEECRSFSDIEHGIQLRDMVNVLSDNCDCIQIEQEQNILYGKNQSKKEWNSCNNKFDDNNNVHDDNDGDDADNSGGEEDDDDGFNVE